MEMMKRRLHLWIHEMTINLKNVALRIVVRSKILILLSPRVKKKVKLFLAVLASCTFWKATSREKYYTYSWGCFCLSGDCRRIFKMPVTRKYTRKGCCGRVSFQHWWDWLLYKNVCEWTYSCNWTPKLMACNYLRTIPLMICKNYVLSEVSWCRNTNQTRLCIGWLTKMLCQKNHRNLALYFQ